MPQRLPVLNNAWETIPLLAQVRHVAGEGSGLFLVGGAVRDLLMGRECTDWDFITLSGATATARRVAKATGGTLVPLHDDPQAIRVAVRAETGQQVYLDFAEPRGGTLETDLGARDLSINALAHDPATQTLIDLHDGVADLCHRRLRALSRENLCADPLRCLRVYRFYSQLGFTITGETSSWVREIGWMIASTAGERIGEEMMKLLQPPRAGAAIARMDADGLLGLLVPEIEPMRHLQQGRFHHLDVLGHTLLVIRELEKILQYPQRVLTRNRDAVAAWSAPHKQPMLLLAALLHDIGKPVCRSLDEQGRLRFVGHDRVGAQTAEAVCRRWALSGAVRRGVRMLVRHHLWPILLANAHLRAVKQGNTPPGAKAIHRLFRRSAPDSIGLLLLALADIRACRGPASDGTHHPAVEQVLDEMLTRHREVEARLHEPPLLTGHDLIRSGYTPGRIFKKLLDAVEEARLEGEIATREQALVLVRQLAAPENGRAAGNE